MAINSKDIKNISKSMYKISAGFICLSILCLIISTNSLGYILEYPALNFAQASQEEDNNLQSPNNLLNDDKRSETNESSDSNGEQKKSLDTDSVGLDSQDNDKKKKIQDNTRIITNSKLSDICGINPNAPPCCTPGKDENCSGNGSVNIGPDQDIRQTEETGNIDEGYVGEVEISDFETTPAQISPGIIFTYDVKVTNGMNVPIYFYNSCSKTSLGYNVENTIVTQHKGSFCDDLTVNKVKLDPGASTTAYGPGKGYVFAYYDGGQKEVEVNLYYNVEHPNGQEQHTDWKSFTINVSPP